MIDRTIVSIIIPCHNEEKGIGRVIEGIPHDFLKKLDFDAEIIVIDNNSTDKTAQVALGKNVKVIREAKKGKGIAMKTGFKAISPKAKYVVMIDGDDTYKAKEIIRLIEPLMTNFCDVAIGSRLGGKIKKHSFKLKNRIANWIYTFLVRLFYRANTTDVLSGYYAWKREVIDDLITYIEADGFALEMEMVTKMIKLGYEMYSVPITFDERRGHSKLESIPDGIKILQTFYKNLFWSPKNSKKGGISAQHIALSNS